MVRLSAKWRINMGLVGLLVSVLCIAVSMRLVPDWRAIAAKGRTELCESLAISGSAMVGRNDIRSLRQILEISVARNDAMLSAAVRRNDGREIVAIGKHGEIWRELPEGQSTDSHVRVPIWANKRKWGDAEFCFEPLESQGVLAYLWSPWTRFVSFVGAASALVFIWYLGKMLEHLNPTKVVPGRVRTALDTLAEGVVVLDARGRIVLANHEFGATMGQSQEQLIGRQLSDFAWAPPTYAEAVGEYPWIHSLSEGASEEAVMLRLTESSAGERTYMVNCSPVLGDGGKPQGVLVSFEDVTPLEEKKEELSRAKAAAESASRAKTEFLANMSHEIRTPMNAILGFTDVLRRGFEKNESERRDHLNTIHASGQHLLNLINDILDLSKVEAGRLELELMECSPHQLVAEVIAVLKVKADEKHIALDYCPEGPLPETIQTDPGRLRQTLMNLVGNAIKFTENGGVRIVCRMADCADQPKMAFEVVDTGIGMATDTLDKIFEPFAQADGSVTRRFGGTGLGLAISRRFAEALGGQLSVDSQLGSGSKFALTVEVGSLDGVTMLRPDEAQTIGVADVTSGEAPQALPPARILVVDDAEENRELLALVLGEVGAQVEMAENGRQAVDMAMQQAYDVILMDMQMPIMDGYTAAGTLRSHDYDGPIIALTAHAMAGDEEKCLSAGCSGFLTKPIDIDQLFQTLAAILGGASQESASAQAAAPRPAAPSPSAPLLEDSSEPLVSTLPTHKPQFAAIVRKFDVRLEEQLAAMDEAQAAGDCAQIAQLAHWLKGSGGNVGFGAFVEPARRLEELAKQQKVEEFDAAIAGLRRIAGRLVMPPEEVGVGASK